MSAIDWAALRTAATDAMRNAYVPYSNFPVGAAALVSDGRVVVGCNVENASYGLTLCAECGVVSSFQATGGGTLLALACVDRDSRQLMPCGRCRQLLFEHGGGSMLIDHVSGALPLDRLLLDAFGPANLGVHQQGAPQQGAQAQGARERGAPQQGAPQQGAPQQIGQDDGSNG
ncbi:MAG: cytidine deaminase [Acidothermaceae bacterium]